VKECLPCPAGIFCDKPGRVNIPWANTDANTRKGWTVCKKGFYCPSLAERLANANPANRYYEMEPCPKGTYNAITNKILATDCLPCPATKACNEKGMGDGAPANLPTCAKGFFCTLESPSTHPYTTVSGKYGPCPPGSFCGAATTTPTPCPVGTYSN